jgi:hypothetical protein
LFRFEHAYVCVQRIGRKVTEVNWDIGYVPRCVCFLLDGLNHMFDFTSDPATHRKQSLFELLKFFGLHGKFL